MPNQLQPYFYYLLWSDSKFVLHQAIADCSLCDQNFYYFLVETFNLLSVQLIFLLPVVKVLQMFFLSWEFLKSLGYRGLESVMHCKHPFVKVHSFIQCFPNYVCQFCSSLAVEIHDFMLDMQIFYTLLRCILWKFLIGIQPSQLNLDDFCNLLSSFFKFSHYYRDLLQYGFWLLNLVELIYKFHLNLIHLYFE